MPIFTGVYFKDKFKINVPKIDIPTTDIARNETQSKTYNNSLFPRSIRALIVGKSDCGEQRLVFRLQDQSASRIWSPMSLAAAITFLLDPGLRPMGPLNYAGYEVRVR